MKIRLGRKYTYAELAILREDPEMAGWAVRGYVWRQDLDGTLTLVHNSKAAAGGPDFAGGHKMRRPLNPTHETVYVPDTPQFDKADLPPIVKRTPQERVDSLMSKVGDDLAALDPKKVALWVPGWHKGMDTSTGEGRKAVGAAFLEQAQAQDDVAESHKFARRGPQD